MSVSFFFFLLFYGFAIPFRPFLCHMFVCIRKALSEPFLICSGSLAMLKCLIDFYPICALEEANVLPDIMIAIEAVTSLS